MQISAKVTPIDSPGSTVGIARVYLDDSFVIGNIAVRKTQDGKIFASMPSYKTNQVDDEGKPVYKDICFPTTKEFREEIQSAVRNAYLEADLGVNKPAPVKRHDEPEMG